MSDSDKKIIIAIDGFSSSGKSTMARALAAAVGYRYVDTGAMYRAVTLWAIEHGLIGTDGVINVDALTSLLPDIHIDFRPETDGQHTLLNGRDVEREIRGMDVSNHVSRVAAIPAVRHHLVALQQRMGQSRGIVMDGRDIGTTVFPDAELKIYLTASAETRARRRYDELSRKGTPASYEEVLANVQQRDHADMTRAESPLRRADDALDLDNSQMSLDRQNQWLIERFNEALQRARHESGD